MKRASNQEITFESKSKHIKCTVDPTIMENTSENDRTMIVEKEVNESQTDFSISDLGMVEDLTNAVASIGISAQRRDSEVQVNFLEDTSSTETLFICNRYIRVVCESETQVSWPVDNKKSESVQTNGHNVEVTDTPTLDVFAVNTRKKDHGTYVDFQQGNSPTQKVFTCNQYIGFVHDAETQACVPPYNIKNKSTNVQCEKTSEKEGVPLRKHENEVRGKSPGFHGFVSIKREQEMTDLAGVSKESFNLLLKILRKDDTKVDERKMTSDENKLLIFLIKMKCGLTFSAISVLFNVHRTTISRIFYATLHFLALACKNFVYWPQKEVVQETMPSVFKPDYANCRVIIDATEFVVEKPPTIEHRVKMYSHYKKGFRIKIVVGCTPSGFICLVSNCYGGRATDAQITVSSKLLELLEPGDLILADKGFPIIKTMLDESGRNILLVMPPFLHNQTFTEEQVEETYNIAKVRIHIERIMQRIRIYKIVDKFTVDMLPHADAIIFMCCVLVNLQPPILKDN